MSGIKSVAIAGASGTLGPHVLKALVEAGFEVTVLTRSKKAGPYDPTVKIVEVDYTSMESLTAALQGIDGLVATVTTAAIDSQTILIDAAVAAGVKQFIPSEFGTCTDNPQLKDFPIYAPMFKIKQYLQEKAEARKLTWTVLACGAFLEFLLGGPSLLDFPNRKATLYDEGDNRISSTSLPNIGKAVAGIFQNFEATKNKVVYISEVILTQNQVLKIVDELRPDIKWEVNKIQTSALLKEGLDGASAGDFTMPTVMKILAGTAFAGTTYGSAYEETENELLGVKEMTEDDVKKLVAATLENGAKREWTTNIKGN